MVTPFPNSQGPAKTCAPGPAPGGGSVPRSPGGRFSAACEKAAVVRKPVGPPSALLCAERRGLTARHAPEPRSHPRGRAFACVGEGREAPSGSPAGHPRPPSPKPRARCVCPGGGGRALVCHTPPATPLPTFLGLPCRAGCWGAGGSRSSSAPHAATRQSQRAHVRGGPVPQTRETLTVIKD